MRFLAIDPLLLTAPLTVTSTTIPLATGVLANIRVLIVAAEAGA